MNLTLKDLCVPPLRSFSATVETGELIFLTGTSGSGKTRLLRALADMIPVQGDMRLDGVCSVAVAPQIWRHQVMMVPNPVLWWGDHLLDHLPDGLDQQWLQQQCDDLGLPDDIVATVTGRYSLGQSQRLGLVRALAMQPRILLLDEISANLDEQAEQLMEKVISDFLKRGAVIWISHSEDQIQRMGSRLWRIEEGYVKDTWV